jgi:diguanylate cyclase
VVDIAGSEMIGLEALVRWQHPDLGLLEPADFLDVAEETGLLVPIGAWVLHEACSQTARWCAELPQESPLSIAVNLSARQLNDPELVSIVDSALAATRLDPSLLTLEINETVLVENRERAADVLQQLAARGVRIGIDEFGTGQSSLAHLNEFPVHTLKIDRSLIEGLGHHQADSAIVSAIVGLGHALGFTVTAEGIENDMQLHTMRTLGCDLAQGYYFARPQPGEVVRALVHHRFRWSERVSA